MTIKHLICLKCEDFVFSFSRHSMNFCSCGACALDGGTDYQKITGNAEDWKLVESDLSIVIETIREKFMWTKNYDRNEKRLAKPVTKKLKQLTTDHIVGILIYFTNKLTVDSVIPEQWKMMHLIFLEELKFRKLK